MTAEELAGKINETELGKDLGKSIAKMAKEAGLIVVYAFDSDLVAFMGAVEFMVYADHSLSFVLVNHEDEWHIKDTDTLTMGLKATSIDLLAIKQQETGKAINLAMKPDELPSAYWQIITRIPHSTFDITFEEDLYCRGIVFSIKDL